MINRAVLIEKLKQDLVIDPATTAVLAIDVHRGHLDPSVATKPLDGDAARKVVQHIKRLLELARGIGIKIIYVIVEQRMIPGVGRESLVNPRTRAVRDARVDLGIRDQEDTDHHNLEGSVQTEIMPELRPEGEDFVIRTKRRLSCFYGTDLEILLRALKVDTLVISGVNTNTCVQGAAFEAHNHDYRAVVVSDCVASMYGEEFHRFALKNIDTCFGWVLSLKELEQKLNKAVMVARS